MVTLFAISYFIVKMSNNKQHNDIPEIIILSVFDLEDFENN